MNLFKSVRQDLPASLVVFFVALPLCLGIALASGAPLFSGIIAGVIGGIVVGSISGSSLGVSGPAAGLTVIVLNAITELGSYEIFLLAVVMAGIIQIIMGLLKAGVIGYYFPTSVIKGMLSAIGIIIFLKQIPHAFGYDADYEGDMNFFQPDGENTFSELLKMADYISPGVILITCVSLFILLLWEKVLSKRHKFFKLFPGPLAAVIVGVLYQLFVGNGNSFLKISSQHLVKVPVPEGIDSFLGQFTTPDFSQFANSEIYVVAITIAIVASLETLLCVEATDKLDPEKRVTPTNRELIAQGAGNAISGLIGGLPVTQVIVRSSANIMSGGKTKLSAILHGFLLILSVIIIPKILNLIPLGVLAAVLLIIGYKLANPGLFKQMFKHGKKQFIPFIVTVVAIVFSDLLIGIMLGFGVALMVILINSYKNSHFLHIESKEQGNKKIKMTLAEEVTFLNKGAISRELDNIPEGAFLELDVTNTFNLDYDVQEILDDFSIKAKNRNITIKLISERGVFENPENFQEIFSKPIKN